MDHYRVRVQVVDWYRVDVPARSPEDAVGKAEGLAPALIKERGTHLRVETGLADPESVELIKPR